MSVKKNRGFMGVNTPLSKDNGIDALDILGMEDGGLFAAYLSSKEAKRNRSKAI